MNPMREDILKVLSSWKKDSSRLGLFGYIVFWFWRPKSLKILDKQIKELLLIERENLKGSYILAEKISDSIQQIDETKLYRKRREVLEALKTSINDYLEARRSEKARKNKLQYYDDSTGCLTDKAISLIEKIDSSDAKIVAHILKQTKDKQSASGIGLNIVYSRLGVRLIRGESITFFPCFYHMTQRKDLHSIVRDGTVRPSTTVISDGRSCSALSKVVYVSRKIETSYGECGIAFGDLERDLKEENISSKDKLDKKTGQYRWFAFKCPIDIKPKSKGGKVSRIILNGDTLLDNGERKFGPNGIPVLSLEEAKLECDLLSQMSPEHKCS